MDTIIQQFLIDTTGNIDTMKTGLVLNQNLQYPKPLSGVGIWVPLLSSIVGGLLVWGGQFFERNKKTKIERRNSLLEIYAYCRRLEATMRNNYRELAMAKLHVEYWWYAFSQFEVGDADEKRRFYEEHLKSQAYAREMERRIGETKADYIGHVRKFQAIKSIPLDIDTELTEISDLTHPKAKTYDVTLPYNTVRNELVEKDEKELRERYYQNLENFQEINDTLQKLIAPPSKYPELKTFKWKL